MSYFDAVSEGFYSELSKISMDVGMVNQGIDSARTALQKARAQPTAQGGMLLDGMKRRLGNSKARMDAIIKKRYIRADTLSRSPVAAKLTKAGDEVRARAERLSNSAKAYQTGRSHLEQLAGRHNP